MPGWPSYPTDRERRMIMHRSMSPRLGSNLNSIFLGGGVEFNQTIVLPPENIGDINLDLEIPDGVTLTLQGTTTTIATGVISAVTATVPTTNTRGNVTNTVGNPVFTEASRLRLTSGGNSGALAWVTGVVGGNLARVSRWGRVNPLTSINPTVVEAAINDTYAVETFQTTLGRLNIRVRGSGRILIRECIIDSGLTAPANRFQNDQIALGGVYIYSCRFIGAASVFYQGQGAFVSCQFETFCAFSNMLAVVRNSVFRGGNVSFTQGTTVNFGRAICFDATSLVIQFSHIGFNDGDIQFVDMPATVTIDIFTGGSLQADPNALAWGANNGAMPFTIHCRSGAEYIYSVGAKPIIPGGVADVNLGGTLFAYAAIPAVNALNGAQMVLFQ